MPTSRFTRIRVTSLSVVLSTGLMAATAFAQAFPSRPVTIVVPFAPGGATDTLTRTLAQKMAAKLGQPVVIENRAGASGMIGTARVAKSAPDGHTVLLGGTGALSVNPYLYKKIAYDAQKDFTPIVLAAVLPNLLVVPQSLPVSSVAEFNAYAKAQDGKVSFGTPGNGTPPHLGAELYNSMAGIKSTHIPYQGGAPAVQDLVAGRTQFMFALLPESLPFVKSGKLKALGATTRERLAEIPDLPTVAETVPGFEFTSWYGYLAPAGTPKDVIQSLNEAFNHALKDPAVQERLRSMGFQPVGGGAEKMREIIDTSAAKWKKVIEDNKITIEQ